MEQLSLYEKIEKYSIPQFLKEEAEQEYWRRKFKECTSQRFPVDIKSFGYKVVLLTLHIKHLAAKISEHEYFGSEELIREMKIEMLKYCHWRIVCLRFLCASDTEKALEIAKSLDINFPTISV